MSKQKRLLVGGGTDCHLTNLLELVSGKRLWDKAALGESTPNLFWGVFPAGATCRSRTLRGRMPWKKGREKEVQNSAGCA